MSDFPGSDFGRQHIVERGCKNHFWLAIKQLFFYHLVTSLYNKYSLNEDKCAHS